ncbi:MAG: XdhC family protein [Acidimicrobiales bacterium]
MIPELAAAIQNGEAVVLATVVRTHRSVPRRHGSKMLVFADGRTVGTIGGGLMEHRVELEAATALSEGTPRLLSYALVDPSDGDPGVCGGEVEIYLEPYMPSPTLFVIGAGHVGKAVVDLGHWLGLRVLLWDDRADLIDGLGELDTVEGVHTGAIEKVLDSQTITSADSIVMVTRNVALDVEILPHLLATSAGYVGLMGSNRRWVTTRAALVESGAAEADLDRIHAPIGIEIHAETPEEIAVSILAEVIGNRHVD